ncbi:conserved hypothetical protein [Thermotomaculum hydrothermale]|uniref:Peptidase S55 domain-containing protein n=1 Tax=Thermotomaculum hydrothermale TaxID=981385 RepID=A0A7R6PLC7_9BACT|nr:SpoIVB peptidase S55 domain-containing protein [Thermotomaculum hydrothermale]BBB31703.1 conserved hypothetical protein [Thermotomaculum hydrothermale]
MKKVIVFFMILASISVFSQDFIYSRQLKPGMKGYGLTVFQGDKIEKFKVDILGVLKNMVPGENRVLIRCEGDFVNKAGIIAGMSGSPVFIDGKLAGAVSFGWEFGKEPIGGLTPIEDMLDVINTYSSGEVQEIMFDKKPNIEDIINPKPENFMPERLKKFFANNDFVATGFESLPFASSGTGGIDYSYEKKPEEGGPIAVALTRGDLNLYAIGTITYVKNNYILAFGHPMFGLGHVSIPIHSAKILAIYPSYKSSNKIGIIGKEIGTLVEDRSAAILGIKGKKAYMIPINVKLNLKNKTKEYSIEVAEEPLLTPFLVNLVFSSVLQNATKNVGFSTFNLRGKIKVEGYPDIILNSLITGANYQTTVYQIASLVSAVIQNPYVKARIEGISVDLNFVEDIRFAQIMKVKSSTTKVKRGKSVHLQVYLKPFQKDLMIKNVIIKVPKTVKPGKYYIELGDGFTIMKRQSKVLARRIETLDGFIRLVNRFLRNNKVYVSLAGNTNAVFMGESVQPDLPGSIVDTIKTQSTYIPKTNKWKQYYSVDILTLPYVVKGYFLIPIEIE